MQSLKCSTEMTFVGHMWSFILLQKEFIGFKSGDVGVHATSTPQIRQSPDKQSNHINKPAPEKYTDDCMATLVTIAQ
jgi:hypothetical protein